MGEHNNTFDLLQIEGIVVSGAESTAGVVCRL